MISVLNHLQQLSGNKFFYIVVTLLVLGACSPKTNPVINQPLPKSPETVAQPKKEEPKKETLPKVIAKPEMVVSMLLPFDLEDVDYKTATLKELDKAKIAIDFYQGFKMGLDSIAKNGDTKFKLQVFDSKDDPTYLRSLAAKSDVRSSGLIVGPIFPNGIKTFSAYAKSMKTPMVSPLAASDPGMFDNPYLITVNSSLDQHTYKAVSFIKATLSPKKVILIRSGQADDYKFAVPFKKGMDSLAKSLPFSEIGIKAVGYENVYKSLNPVGLNVIVLPSTDRTFLLTIFKELDKLSDKFQIAVIGHPGWEKAQFLDFSLLEKLNTYITSSYQIDYKSTRNLNFIKYYRAQFALEPSEFAFKGFDMGYYFGKLMDAKGKAFLDELTSQPFDGIHNDFKFVKDAHYGYYNASLMVLKYQQGQLKKVN
jgi:hypothetical protein